ncbi:uncharacterized protein LOC132166415 [Corylus avellana]|uniref:uncharacterized protein LOC132166415 n=1 Tax=Corylus avellana TaxID=13451 RepID=UPI00286BEDCE|nr:uncharacterized protein LOC132166415 [Corylus avellana]
MEEAPNMYLLQDPLDCNCLTRLTLLANTPAASSFPTESELALASVSPALGKEVSNHLTRCYSNGMTSNTITAINGNRDGYSAYTAINRVEEETTGEVVDSNMLCVLPDSNMFHVPPDLNVFCVPPELLGLSPLHLQMQSVYMPYSVANDSIYLGDEVPFQYGTNVPAAFTSDLCGPPSLFR